MFLQVPPRNPQIVQKLLPRPQKRQFWAKIMTFLGENSIWRFSWIFFKIARATQKNQSHGEHEAAQFVSAAAGAVPSR